MSKDQVGMAFYTALSGIVLSPLLIGIAVDFLFGTKPVAIIIGLFLGMILLVFKLIQITKQN